jgi:hypothetical protein
MCDAVSAPVRCRLKGIYPGKGNCSGKGGGA